MPAITPIRDEDIEFDHGSFDSAGFAKQALADWQSLAQVIDHTLLKPEATREQIESLCDEAIRYRFACAMVNPVWVPTAVGMLTGTGIRVGVVRHPKNCRRPLSPPKNGCKSRACYGVGVGLGATATREVPFP